MRTSSASTPDQTVVEYPIEISAIDISRWREGNAGVPYVYRLTSSKPGPHVAITALVHGNEPAGAIALDRLLSRGFCPARGTLTVVFANTQAYANFDYNDPRASRWVEEDMNRVWSSEVLAAVPPRSADAARAAELLPLVKDADFLLDLHTTQHANEPLVLAGPLERNQRLARYMSLTDLVVVDKGHAQGPRLRDHGLFGDPESQNAALLIECGQHWEASSPEVAYAACMRLLSKLEMVQASFEPGELVELPDQATRFVEITMPVTIRHEFSFALPLVGGEIIPKAGTLIGTDGGEPVVTPHDDCVVIMPSQRLWAGLTAVRLGRMITAPEASLPSSYEANNG